MWEELQNIPRTLRFTDVLLPVEGVERRTLCAGGTESKADQVINMKFGERIQQG